MKKSASVAELTLQLSLSLNFIARSRPIVIIGKYKKKARFLELEASALEL